MKVTRCQAISRDFPIRNILVDEANVKWVGFGNGVYEVKACDIVEKSEFSGSANIAFAYVSGNSEFSWTNDQLSSQLDVPLSSDNRIETVYFDASARELYIGTTSSGLYRFKTDPTLQKLEHLTVDNSKLPSNSIQNIFQDKVGDFWVGTEDGLMVGRSGKWRIEGKFYNVKRVRQYGTNRYLLADGELFRSNNGGRWNFMPFEVSKIEGEIYDFDIDSEGYIYLISKAISKYDPVKQTYEHYDQFQDFTSEYATCVAVDKDNAVWVGTRDKGLYLLEKNSAITVVFDTDKALDCNNYKPDAEVSTKVIGGKTPYKYKWSTGATTPGLKGIGAGEYSLTVTDAEGKSKVVKTLVDDPRLTVEVAITKEASSPTANDGSAECIVKGGKPKYSYNWDSGETTNVAKKLTAGKHTVSVNDSKGCVLVTNFDLTGRSLPLTVVIKEKTKVLCAGTQEASLLPEVSGGKAPYSFKWSSVKTAGNDEAKGLAPGDYTLTVTDARGVTTTATYKVQQPDPIVLNIKVDVPAGTNKADGRATVSAKGGTGAFTYLWDTQEKTATAAQLVAGKHQVTVTDANGCTSTATIDILENITALQVSLVEKSGLRCADAKDGAIQAAINGGKPPFSFKWSVATATSEEARGLAAGDYTVTVSDASGKTATSTVKLKAPDVLTATLKIDAPATTNNADGKATASVRGGASPYTYAWDNQEKGQSATKLAPGKRSVTITDANGCTTTATVEISENILELQVSLSEKTTLKCADAKDAILAASVSGGKSPYTYKWTGAASSEAEAKGLAAGEYAIIVSDASGKTATAKTTIKAPDVLTATLKIDAPATTNNADGKATASVRGGASPYSYAWDNQEKGQSATKLAPGKRSVTITDANGCTTTATVEISENILELQVSLSEKTALKCADAKDAILAASVSGGKSPYTYKWTGAASSEAEAEGLAAGEYTLLVSDASGKTATAKTTLKAPDVLTATLKIDAPATTNNADGKATASVRGGTNPYTYAWDNQEKGQSATKLAPGKRTVTITDANGCTTTASADISENILALQVSLSEKTALKCADAKDAILAASVSGGKSPYTYRWTGAASTEAEANGLAAGEYTLSVSDASGKTATAKASIKAPEALIATISKSSPAMNENTNDGKATVITTGGKLPLSIAWDNGETSAVAEKLAIGNHTVTVTDANGCKTTANVEVKKKILPQLTAGLLKSGQTLKMEQLNFDADSTNINQASRPVIDELFSFLEENPTVVVEVGGHTNSIPPDDYCDRISAARAKAVADYIISKGIDSRRIFSKGYGKRNPVANNATPEGRKQNQRVEIKILELGQKN